MNYSQFVQILAGLLVPSSLVTITGSAVTFNDTDFQNELPDIINYAENRIYRDLDFLETRATQVGLSLASNNKILSLAGLSNLVIVLEQVAITVPPSTLTRQSVPYMSLVWAPAPVGPPVDFAMTDQQTIIVGPTPDQSYPVSIYGTIRPPQLSAANPTTWLATNLPELYTAAAMIRASGWRKDFAAAGSDDPQASGYWSMEYSRLLEGSATEEARRLAQSASWSDQKQRQQSTPPRQ